MYKTSCGVKPLLVIFDKVDGFIRKYERTKCLPLFRYEKYEGIFQRIRYLFMLKAMLYMFFSRKYLKIKINGKALDMINVMILRR